MSITYRGLFTKIIEGEAFCHDCNCPTKIYNNILQCCKMNIIITVTDPKNISHNQYRRKRKKDYTLDDPLFQKYLNGAEYTPAGALSFQSPLHKKKLKSLYYNTSKEIEKIQKIKQKLKVIIRNYFNHSLNLQFQTEDFVCPTKEEIIKYYTNYSRYSKYLVHFTDDIYGEEKIYYFKVVEKWKKSKERKNYMEKF